ncbi:hypothetical protein TIFTF001_043946, partial [Ficus carica]
MSTPTKISKKNTRPERRSVRVTAKSSKRSSAGESFKNPVPAIERMVFDAGLKRKQGEMDVKDSKKLISAVEDKISKAEEYEAVKDQPCIQQFMHLDTLGWAGQVFHNIVMRLTDHSGMGDALWFELGEDLGKFSINEFCLITGMKCVGSTYLPVMLNTKFDNDDDAVKLSLLYIIFCIHLSNASAVKIDPKFFALADNLDTFNDFPWGVLSWEATRAAIFNTMENRMSSKRRPLKKNDKVHYSILGFSHALLVWAYETFPSIASKFTTKYDQAIPRMMSWTTADNVKFDDVLAAFTTVGESQLKCFNLMPTEEELKNPWVAWLYLKNPKVVHQLPPPKSSVPRLSTDTKSEWQEFQKEIRGQVASLNNKLEDLKKEQMNSNKLLRMVLKMLSANMIEKGQGKAQTAPHVSNSREINAQRAESDVLQTTSPDICAVVDMGVQAAMEFLTADKVNIKDHLEGNEEEANVKYEPFVEIKEDSMPDLEKGIPKKKRARLSKLGQRPSGHMTEVGSPSKGPNKFIYALPPGLADEPPKETLEEFREWIKKGVLKRTPPGKRLPRYNAKHETLDKPYDLGFIMHIDVAFYYLRKKISQFPELEQRKVTTVDTFFSSNVRSLWRVYQSSRDKFDWGSCESILKIMLGLDLTSWTIEVYDSLQHEGPHNSKVREGVECISTSISLLAERLNLFDFKPREPLGSYQIPVTTMKDIPQQAN